jgi:hypothetical protein
MSATVHWRVGPWRTDLEKQHMGLVCYRYAPVSAHLHMDHSDDFEDKESENGAGASAGMSMMSDKL